MSPCDYRRYPKDWKETSYYIRFIRAGGKCEWPRCTAEHGKPHPVTGSKVCLTTAHLGVPKSFTEPGNVHDKMDCRHENLLALCNMHHLRLDADEHTANRRKTLEARKRANQPEMELI